MGPDKGKMTDRQLLLDHVRCGAWPFLRGGMYCVVNSINERELIPLTRFAERWLWEGLLRGTLCGDVTECSDAEGKLMERCLFLLTTFSLESDCLEVG